jgi:hypothetical protein
VPWLDHLVSGWAGSWRLALGDPGARILWLNDSRVPKDREGGAAAAAIAHCSSPACLLPG